MSNNPKNTKTDNENKEYYDTDNLLLEDNENPQKSKNKTHFYERIFTTEEDERENKFNSSKNEKRFDEYKSSENNKLFEQKNDRQCRQYAFVSFIVGLCAIITFNIILAIISIIFANNSIPQKGEMCLYAKTGYICSIITIIGSVLLIFIILIIGAVFSISFQNIFQNILPNIF